MFLQNDCPFPFKSLLDFLESCYLDRLYRSHKMPVVTVPVVVTEHPAIITGVYEVVDVGQSTAADTRHKPVHERVRLSATGF